MAAEPWQSEMVARIKQRHGSGVEALSYLGQNYLVADISIVSELLQTLRDEEQFAYCVDVTALHYPEREKPFEVIWILSLICYQRTNSGKNFDCRWPMRAQFCFYLAGGELARARSL